MADPNIAVRASDADRERVVEILRRGNVDGRLTLAELEERAATAYAARTWDELAPLTADLPAPSQERAAPVRERPTYVVFAVLLAAWVVAVAVFGVFIPPLPLLLFLVFRMIVFRMPMARRRHPA